jgi:Taurine catabolism dioxygenase TauD, TfdA family
MIDHLIDPGIFTEITNHGFYAERRDSSANSAKYLWNFVRAIRPKSVLCTRLRPLSLSTARQNTLSAKYGLGDFPLHTDFSVNDCPARYIILFCPVQRTAATRIYDGVGLDTVHVSLAQRGLFRVERNRNPFIAHALEVRSGNFFFRFNSDVMTPLDEAARTVVTHLTGHHKLTTLIDWRVTSFLILDNWRCLHSRNAVLDNCYGWLWRIGMWL